MKKNLSVMIVAAISLLMLTLSGCAGQNSTSSSTQSVPSAPEIATQDSSSTVSQADSVADTGVVPDLTVRFGYDGEAYTIHMEDNETARAIARYVGQSDWNLPIYHYDDFDGWEYMQYYDIPSRYEIPSEPETTTVVKAGEVYYSDPNRMILIYQDAEISGEYTKVGTIDYSEEFVEAVENNPVLEGWGNKIVSISPTD